MWATPVVPFSSSILGLAVLLISTALSALSFYTVERWAMRHRDLGAGNKPARQPQARQEPALREATRGS